MVSEPEFHWYIILKFNDDSLFGNDLLKIFSIFRLLSRKNPLIRNRLVLAKQVFERAQAITTRGNSRKWDYIHEVNLVLSIYFTRFIYWIPSNGFYRVPRIREISFFISANLSLSILAPIISITLPAMNDPRIPHFSRGRSLAYP